ncbi:Alpha/Beta hydrolase protein [Chlamydoabsidia padenii]|nr:Alpha/Beta hydrolase protein [Chlamydoabsidia padenii]
MSLASFRDWLIVTLLKYAFISIRPAHCRFFVYCLQLLLKGVDDSWLLYDEPRGLWLGNHISSDKKENLSDRLVTSDVVILWVPGGGFRFDLRKLYLPALIHWIKKLAAKDTKCTILLANYRHYPNHPFPAAMEDITTIHYWLLNDMGVPRTKLMWGADDAGAAIGLDALYYKIKPQDKPCGLILSSPYIGLDPGGKSWHDNGNLDIITPGAIDRMEGAYSSQHNNEASDDDDDDYNGTLSSTTSKKNESAFGYLEKSDEWAKYLPPMILVDVGGHEVLLDDVSWLATKIRESGCPGVTLLQSPGQIHLGTLLGLPFVSNSLDWERSLDRWVDFVKGALVP